MLSAAAEFGVRPFWEILPDTSMQYESPSGAPSPVRSASLFCTCRVVNSRLLCFVLCISPAVHLFKWPNSHYTAKRAISKCFVLIFVMLTGARDSRFFVLLWDSSESDTSLTFFVLPCRRFKDFSICKVVLIFPGKCIKTNKITIKVIAFKQMVLWMYNCVWENSWRFSAVLCSTFNRLLNQNNPTEQQHMDVCWGETVLILKT